MQYEQLMLYESRFVVLLVLHALLNVIDTANT